MKVEVMFFFKDIGGSGYPCETDENGMKYTMTAEEFSILKQSDEFVFPFQGIGRITKVTKTTYNYAMKALTIELQEIR